MVVATVARVTVAESAPADRVIDAALECIARWGTAKTTLDDVARQAGYSRATVYRVFPGGKDAVLEAVARTEIARFFSAVAGRLQSAETLEDVLVGGMTEAGVRIRNHRALQFLLAYEPETILPHLAFSHCDEVLRCASAVAAPYLTRWLPPDDALRAAEWATRLVMSYSSVPATDVDMADEASVRRLVQTFVLPGLQLLVRPDVPATSNQ
jgi:AcrR family transcriptional regulator